MISELYERKRHHDAWDTLEILLPSSRRGWVLLVGFIALVFILWTLRGLHARSATQGTVVHLSSKAAVWERKLWWGFLTRQGIIGTQGATTCRTTKGTMKNVVDSRGVQCAWED